MKAARLLAANVSALLTARNQKQADLAQWCRKSDPWVSQFLRGERNWQLPDLDRVADFFGIATYQLFQPGINALTERRVSERRTGRERRIGHAQRMLGVVRAELETARPKRGQDEASKDSAAIRALTHDFERRLTALLAQTDARRQAASARLPVTKPRLRTGTIGRSDPTEPEKS